jgi:heterodisulfide reductase subunit C
MFSGSVSGWRSFFKTRYGRTGQSTVPVRCTPDSAQEKEVLRACGRCTGQCTVQCPVHTELSGEPRQREILQFLKFSI